MNKKESNHIVAPKLFHYIKIKGNFDVQQNL